MNSEGKAQGRALRPVQTAQKLGIGLSTVWAKVKTDPLFPQPIKIGPRTTVFLEAELDQYLAVCAERSKAGYQSVSESLMKGGRHD